MNEDHLYLIDAAKYLHRLPVRHRSQKAATDSPKPEGQDKPALSPEAKKGKLPETKNDGQPK